MDLDRDSCYRAFTSRDPRFDGRFFVGVRTTGIYCRPICPARTPRATNVEFFPCAAAAEESGFRACRRCRPETAPGTPAWNGSSTTVARALRLIRDGALDEAGLPELAARLGVGERHLRRLFTRHLGASPLAVARTRRVHFARRLIDETDLPMGHVANGSGFRSVRQFNHDVRRTFHASPTELRRRVRREAADAEGITLHLPYRPPLDWGQFVAYLELRALPGVEAIDASGYRRAVRGRNGPGLLEVSPVPSADRLRLHVVVDGESDLIGIVERVRRLFDLETDPAPIAAHLRRDPILRPRVDARPGLRVPGAFDPLEVAVRAVLGQQVTVRGATTIAGRLVRRFGEPLATPRAGLTHLFPSPETLAEADLAALGMPGRRAAAIRGLAAAVARGTLDLSAMATREEAVRALAALPGLGSWTAEYVALRAMACPDAFPAGDLGLRKAVSTTGEPASARELAVRAESWRPWRGYAAMHLWSEPGIARRRPGRKGHEARVR
ncbi:MAG: AlkA N-terminal domain-containing protein, partial [Acidobacteriota bacterium]